MNRVILIVPLIILTGCRFYPRGASSHNYASTYRDDVGAIRAEYKIYHTSDIHSEIIFQVHSKDLLYTRNDKSDAFRASFRVNYIVFDPKRDNYILDSNSTTVVDRDNKRSDKYIVGRLRSTMRSGEKYMVELSVTDLNRNSSKKTAIVTDKRSKLSGDNFLVTRGATGRIHFDKYIDYDDTLVIQSLRNKEGIAYVSHYEQSSSFPPPPFSRNPSIEPDLSLDTTYTINRDTAFMIALRDKGIYTLSTDTTAENGLILYRFEKGFPNVNSPEAMLYPLRYICTKEEFEKLSQSENIRSAVEGFWIDLAGNKERARQLIRKYYKRVESTNKEFTSFNPGWRTDRGLVFVIFGSPEIVRKHKEREVWIYGEEGNALAISFTFDRIDNKYSDNHYRLRRNTMYKSSWYRGVETWRSGRSYSAR